MKRGVLALHLLSPLVRAGPEHIDVLSFQDLRVFHREQWAPGRAEARGRRVGGWRPKHLTLGGIAARLGCSSERGPPHQARGQLLDAGWIGGMMDGQMDENK